MPPSGVDYASEFLNGYAPEYVVYEGCVQSACWGAAFGGIGGAGAGAVVGL